jgi:hypothetical protein
MKEAFKLGKTFSNIDAIGDMRGGDRYEWAEHAYGLLHKMTEAWSRKALEAGPGWNFWRSNPYHKDGDIFVITHDFALVAPGEKAPGAGVLFQQPELTDGERTRLLAGRHDWQEDRWQDHCGVGRCGHPCCEQYREGI